VCSRVSRRVRMEYTIAWHLSILRLCAEPARKGVINLDNYVLDCAPQDYMFDVSMLLKQAVRACWALNGNPCTKQASRALATVLPGGILPRKVLGSMASLTHEERTAAELRQPGLHTVVLDKIDQVNHNIRLLQLKPSTPEAKKSIKVKHLNACSKFLLTFDTYSSFFQASG